MSISDYLTLSQTVFFAVFSFVIIIVGILLAIVIYYLVKITKHANKISDNLEHASDDVKKNIHEIVEALSKLPIVSVLFKKSRKK